MLGIRRKTIKRKAEGDAINGNDRTGMRILIGVLSPRPLPIRSVSEALTRDATRVSEDLARAWDASVQETTGLEVLRQSDERK